jgi:amino acid adenylation domain-containing protein/non-ribosomal peptide synthase protein (TIGR01720 family)
MNQIEKDSLQQSEIPEEEIYQFPASFGQQRLWFLDRLEPGSSFYNIPCAVRLLGLLDEKALENALNAVIARHEILRTIFSEEDGQPLQIILPRRPLRLVCETSTATGADGLQQLIEEEAKAPFDLQRGPLLRVRLIKVGVVEHLLLLTMHHIISDGWSMGVLVREIAALYTAASQGRENPLPDLPLQYADYAVWQRERLNGVGLEQQLDYWREQLGGEHPALNLPFDHPRPPVQTYHGAVANASFPLSLLEKIRSLSSRENATEFMTLLAGFSVLLHRYTDQQDICVGTPIANRSRSEIEGLIGLFINTLVLRAQINGTTSFRELLHQVRETTLQAYAHQDVPFDLVVDALHPQRDSAFSPLFQVMFILQNMPVRFHELPGLTLEMLEAETGASTFDLTFSLAAHAAGLEVSVEYNTDLFDPATIQRLLGHYQALLEALVCAPDTPIQRLPLATEEESAQLLEWSGETRVDPRAAWTIQRLFEQIAAHFPERPAVVSPSADPDDPSIERMTYRELNHRANQIAHKLRELGVGPGTLTGICLDRSCDRIAAVLGCFKAGCAYLPLDPASPAGRLTYMLKDSGASAIVTHRENLPGLTGPTGSTGRLMRILCLDDENAFGVRTRAGATEDPPCLSRPDDLAYVIYTSGSTGSPKGVEITQRNITNAYLAWEEEYMLNENLAHLQMAAFSFDVFVGDLVRALCSGGKLVLCPREVLLSPRHLVALMHSEHIQCAEFVPTVLRSLADFLEQTHQNLNFMRLLICGSDIWYAGEYQRFQALLAPDARLINSFGLTEATIDSTYYEASDLKLDLDRVVPIGRAFPNTRLYILNPAMQLQPIGVPGELYIGGMGIARGYLNRPEQTAERFIPDIFAGGGRLFKTGDLARFLPDGNLEFLGRLDYQVKIRGVRVETGEVESVLKSHSMVRDAVVVAARPPSAAAGAQQLVAYLVASLSAERVSLRTTCICRVQYVDYQPVQLSTIDISEAGISLANVPATWQPGTRLILELSLPGLTLSEELRGKVAWNRKGSAGILFEPNPEYRQILREKVKEIARMQELNLQDLRAGGARIPIHSSCQVELEDGTTLTQELVNISHGGARLTIGDSPLSNGQRVTLHFGLPGWNGQLSLRGAVCWRSGANAGISFTVDSEERDWLNLAMTSALHAAEITVGDLRDFLKQRLPDAMIPSLFVIMDTLPLTSNGKVDRKALPPPDWSHLDLRETYLAPRTPVEELLTGIWIQLLGVQRVGVQDNFFELGGHSLLATQLISRVRSIFQVELPVRAVFDAPTIDEMGQRIEALQRKGAHLDYPPLKKFMHSGELPLSFAQQRLWFLDQMEPMSAAYNQPESVRLIGELDVASLELSLNEVIRRHEILRTQFITEMGRPRQAIQNELILKLRVEDLRALPEQEREDAVLIEAQREAAMPFDLSSGPLLRARLLWTADNEHVALLTFHHIISDDWSTRLFIREMAILYSSYSQKQSPQLPAPEFQYADYAAWQRSWLQGDILQTHLDYWKQKLGGLPPLLELPLDHPRPPAQTFRGGVVHFTIPPAVVNELHALNTRAGVTQFMSLLAAFQALLYRYTGQETIPIGTPIANRGWREVEEIIGFFVNTLVLSTDISGEPDFLELLHRVSATSLDAYAHQDLPFELLVDQLKIARDLSYSPLFQVMFVMQNNPISTQEVPGLRIEPLDVHTGSAKFDLTLFMLEENGVLGGVFEYNSDLFERGTIERMATCFQTLLAAAVHAPETPVQRLPLLEAAELQHILVDWNATQRDFPRDLCAQQLIEAQVDRTPQVPAVILADRALTYAELEQRANRLARFLVERGAGPDVLIAICMPRCPEMVVGLLAILKSGGAYVPIDPSYPPDRVAYMVHDSQARVVLTTSGPAEETLRAALQDSSAEIIRLDADWDAIASYPETRQPPRSGPEDLAYVIYTSGSTGKPKGAMIRQRGLVNYLSWCLNDYPLQAGQGSPVQSSFSFDLTVTSLYSPLVAGKTVRLLSDQLGVEALGEILNQQADFSLIKITPAHLQLLATQISPARAADCTHAFIIGGENLLKEHIALWQTNAPKTRLVNEYGPTETVVGCCVYSAGPDWHAGRAVPIGKPIQNTQLYVLDRWQQPVPVGVHGELYIGGEGVGRGYLNRPELTAERFIPDPWRDDPDARLYRTGDLARYLPDGNLECLGRVDFQVKIRGYRVELEEVETVLGRCPGVKETVVWYVENNALKRLVGYYVPIDPLHPPLAASLREQMLHELPEYMVPASFVRLDAIPLTSNGKVDRKQLPPPGDERPETGETYAPPRTPQEQILAEIWSEILGVRPVGIYDNFFALGGDSILSIQVIARAGQAGLRLTPRQLFETQTIAGLAELAGSAPVALAEQGLLSGSVPLAPIQRWFFANLPAHPDHWNQSILLEIPSQIDPAVLRGALMRLLQRHDALRLRFSFDGADWRQEYGPLDESTVPLEIHDFSLQPDETQVSLIEKTAARVQASLNLFTGPILRLALFRLGADRPARLLIAIHHLAVDSVSWRILMDDLLAIARGETLVPVKTTSYRQWVQRLEDWTRSDEAAQDLAYWQDSLAHVQPADALSLPCDLDAGPNLESTASTISVSLDEETTQRLLDRLNDPTPALISALALACRKWTGQPGLLLALESHGREAIFPEIDLSRSVGWFTALYPFYLAPRDEDPTALLAQATDAFARIPHHGVSFGALAYLHPDAALRKRLQALPHPQICLNYLGRTPGDGAETEYSRGPERAPQAERRYLIEVNGGVAQGKLQLDWTYSANHFLPETMRSVVLSWMDALHELVQPANEVASGMKDFDWSDEDIQKIMGALDTGDNNEQND